MVRPFVPVVVTVLSCLAVLAAPSRAADALASSYDQEPTVVRKPDLVPGGRFPFSDELFREPAQKAFRPPERRQQLRDSLAPVQYSVRYVSGTERLRERLDYGAATTLTVGPYTLDVPKTYAQVTRPDRPTLEHRLEFGPAGGRGPRVGILYAMADGASSIDALAGATGTAETKPWDSASRGSRRRTRITVSWPLKPSMLDDKLQESRLYVGWQQVDDDNTRSDRTGAAAPGDWADDSVRTAGPTFGWQGGWAVGPAHHLFLDLGATIVDVAGERNLRLPQSGYRYRGDGWGWDGVLGYRITRRRLSYEVAVTAFTFEQTGGDGALVFVGTSYPLAAPSTTIEGYGLSWGATYRF